jgi:hypothetical protein
MLAVAGGLLVSALLSASVPPRIILTAAHAGPTASAALAHTRVPEFGQSFTAPDRGFFLDWRFDCSNRSYGTRVNHFVVTLVGEGAVGSVLNVAGRQGHGETYESVRGGNYRLGVNTLCRTWRLQAIG